MEEGKESKAKKYMYITLLVKDYYLKLIRCNCLNG